MKKIIFCHIDHEGIVGGLPIIDRRNYDTLRSVGAEVIEMPIKAKKISRLRKFCLYFISVFSVRKKYPIVQSIFNVINGHPNEYIVFFSHSIFGLEINQLRSLYPSLKIVTFFHNIEANLSWREFKSQITINSIKNLLISPIREAISAKKSNLNIFLNRRDLDLSQKYYGKTKTLIFPTTLNDSFQEGKKRYRKDKTPLRLIFVGTYFWGNIGGLKKFILKVLPLLNNVELTIIGDGMEKIKENIPIPINVKVLGYVSKNDLNDSYHAADLAILPILSGGGMKTKTAEAMMYHLPVVGTKEAFCGYEVAESNIGLISDDFGEWVNFINGLTNDNDAIMKMGCAARQLFKDKFEFTSISTKIVNTIQNL